MTNHKPSNKGQGGAKPKRPASSRGKRIRVEPKRRQRVDPDMIALCYWLLAQRIVQEAADDGNVAGGSKAPSAAAGIPADDRATRSAS